MNVKHLVGLTLKFIFRRIDYLGRGILLLVTALIRELSAISYGETVSQIAAQLRTLPIITGYKLLLFNILEIILVGGSWITVSILSIFIIFLVWARYKSKDIVQIRHHFNSQLRQFEKLIKDFKSVTAIELLETFQRDLDDSYIPVEDVILLRAKAFFLTGIVKFDHEDEKFPFKCHISSYDLQPFELKYKERACVSYFYTDQKDKATEVARQIFQQDALNERANVVLIMLDKSFDINLIPQSVQNGKVFKRIYFSFLAGKEPQDLVQLTALFSSEIKNKEVPTTINFDNIDYWEIVSHFTFFLGINKQPNTFSSVKESYKDNELINYCNKLLKVVTEAVVNTEVFKYYKRYKLTAFYYHQTEYLLNDNEESVLQMAKLYQQSLSHEKYSSQLADSVLLCLNQVHKYPEVLKVADRINDSDPHKHLMKFQAFYGLHQKDDAILAFKEYLKQSQRITDNETNNLLFFGDYLLTEKEDLNAFYLENLRGKKYENDLHEKIVYSYLFRHDPGKASEIQGNLALFKVEYANLRYELRTVTAIILFTAKEYESLVPLLETYHDLRNELPASDLYLESLLELRRDSEKLLSALKYRRTFKLKERFLIEEIKIYELIENPEEILAVTRLGMVNFPNNLTFEFYNILSQYKLKKDKELDALLTEGLLEKKFHWKQKAVISRVCIEKDKKILGLELFYRETLQNPKPIIKENYFALTTILGDRTGIPEHDRVEINTWVSVQVGAERLLLRVDDISIQEDKIVKAIVGLKPGDSTDFTDTVLQKKVTVFVNKIYDKYTGLAVSIMDEIGKSDYTGMSIRSIKLEDATAESFGKTLANIFGEAGDKDKIRQDQAFKEYYKRNLSFTELVRAVTKDDVLGIYSFLTSKQSEGFHIIPLRDFNNVPLKGEAEFVIDFTSLPILMKINDGSENTFKHKFVVSQCLIEFLENELSEAVVMPERTVSVSISSQGITPIVQQPGYKEYRISTLRKMLKWIGDYCQIRRSKEKIDMIIQNADLVKSGDLYFNFIIDTVFLSHGRILISDDSFHQRNFSQHYLAVSLEYYLGYFYQDSFGTVMLPILIKNHYIGLTLNHESIKTEFSRPVFGVVDTFQYCLENLPFSVNHNAAVFVAAVDFLKFVYIGSLPLPIKKEISQKVLFHALKHYPDFTRLRQTLINEVRVKFQLLPLQLNDVLDDFTAALEILNRSNQSRN